MQKKFLWLFAAVLVLLAAHAWSWQYDHDEIEHLHSAWLMSIGERPFVDFLEQHHPTLWILFQPLVRAIQSPHALVFAARLFNLAVLAAFCVVLHRLVARFVPEGAPWSVVLVLASFTFTKHMILVRPDPLMNLFLYLGILEWVIFLQEGRRARAAAAGLCFGIAIAVLQKALAISGLVGLASLILIARRPRLLPGAIAALACAALPLLVLFAWVRARGIWPEFWFWNYEFNRFFYTQAALSVHFHAGFFVKLSIRENPGLWFLGIAGLGLWIRRGVDGPRAVLLVAMVGYWLSLALNRFPYQQYFIVVLPLWAPFAAEVFRQPLLAVRALSLAMLLMLLDGVVDVPSNAPQRRLHDHLLANSTSSQTIAVSPPIHPIVRRDASFFWYNGRLMGEACLGYQARHPGALPARLLEDAAWAERPPSLVYLDPENPTYHPYRWPDRAAGFRASPAADLLLPR